MVVVNTDSFTKVSEHNFKVPMYEISINGSTFVVRKNI